MSIHTELTKLGITGATLAWARNTHHFTVEQVADAANIAQSQLRDIEAQTIAVTPTVAAHISAAITALDVGKVRLYCQHCRAFMATVHIPAPSVPVTCSECRSR